MLFAESTFDKDTIALMGRAFDDACKELWAASFFPTAADESGYKDVMAQLILGAVANGERDPERLKAIALGLSH
jgi:hypothetical protein